MSWSNSNPAFDRMHRTRYAGDEVQPPRCVGCNTAVRPGQNDPCKCTQGYRQDESSTSRS